MADLPFQAAGAGTRLITAAATTANIALPVVPGQQVMITASGTGIAYYQFGTSTVTATTPTGSVSGSNPIVAGTTPIIVTRAAGDTHVAVISAAATPIVHFTVGSGN